MDSIKRGHTHQKVLKRKWSDLTHLNRAQVAHDKDRLRSVGALAGVQKMLWNGRNAQQRPGGAGWVGVNTNVCGMHLSGYEERKPNTWREHTAETG